MLSPQDHRFNAVMLWEVPLVAPLVAMSGAIILRERTIDGNTVRMTGRISDARGQYIAIHATWCCTLKR